jgi:hypothetical protein
LHSKLIIPVEIELVLEVLASQVPPDASSNEGNSDDDQYDDESDSAAVCFLVLLELSGIMAA